MNTPQPAPDLCNFSGFGINHLPHPFTAQPMRLSLPRRHRRRLLLPPGLLALAALLWLGCLALRPWRQALKTNYVIELNMPPRPVSDTVWQYSGARMVSRHQLLYSQVKSMRQWQDVILNGNSMHDVASVNEAERAIQKMQADTLHAGGVRILIKQGARYKSLVKMLGLIQQIGVKHNLFDIYHGTDKLYAYTNAYRSPLADDEWHRGECLFCNDVIPYRPTTPLWARFSNWVTNLWHLMWLQPLAQPQWRASLMLLAAMAALSGWRIVRTWRQYRLA